LPLFVEWSLLQRRFINVKTLKADAAKFASCKGSGSSFGAFLKQHLPGASSTPGCIGSNAKRPVSETGTETDYGRCSSGVYLAASIGPFPTGGSQSNYKTRAYGYFPRK